MIIPTDFMKEKLDPWRAQICIAGWQNRFATIAIDRIAILIPEETSKEWKDLNDTSVLKRQTTGYWDSDWWVLQGKSDLLDAIKEEPISRLVDKIFTIAPDNFQKRENGKVDQTQLVGMRLYENRIEQRILGIVYDFGLPPPDC